MARWWECKTCGKDLGEFGDQVLAHREGTGHVGAQLIFDSCPRPSSSTEEGRAAARAILAAALASRKSGNPSGPTGAHRGP